ncbi:solute carrier family 2, facilitated glucose transporter member 1-like isoform X2 [Oratosquilla oratoria]|uniref:solute carrier family 2, facilitated glucose transporter member 1-like isoform X2 n=1 Tax=Oratosquilla oratoria TaxID=337810 RepID=UPI003F762D39
MTSFRSSVKHHPLLQEDSGTPFSGSPLEGSPVQGSPLHSPMRGMSPIHDDGHTPLIVDDLDVSVFTSPPDMSLNLLEVPTTNWRTSGSSGPSSLASSSSDLSTTGLHRRRQGLNARLTFAILACGLGSAFQHGYNLGVINAPQKLIETWIQDLSQNRTGTEMSDARATLVFSWIVSIYCVGGMIGGSLTGYFSQRFGRKGGLLINNVFAIIAAILFGFCKLGDSWEMALIGRFVIGINNGLNAGLAPMYLSEIAPTSLRGAIGTVYQLVVTISILVAQILGLENVLGNDMGWPILLALTGIPALFQLATLPICPESPKFLLINKEERSAAQRALIWLRNTKNVSEEMEEMSNEAEAGKLVPKISLREMFVNPTLRIPLVISMMMMLAQQLSGINAVIFFSNSIYESAGLSKSEALNATIAMGTMNVIMTVISLVLVEKAGRKTLMLIGLSGMLVDTLLLTLCLLFKDKAPWIGYLSIALVILFVVMFATGPGSIPWFLVTELFAQNARPTASSIAVAINWTAAFFVGLGFLPIAKALGPYVFLIFVGLLGLFILFTIKKVPETKGKSIDEITALFKQQAYGADRV